MNLMCDKCHNDFNTMADNCYISVYLQLCVECNLAWRKESREAVA